MDVTDLAGVKALHLPHGEGLQHLGFHVSDLDRRRKMAQELGIPVVFSGLFRMAGGATAKFA